MLLLITIVMLTNRLVYNKFVDEEHFLLISKSRVEIEIQRRHDVVTRCIDAIRQYKQVEGDIQRHLMELNALIERKASKAEQTRVENEVMKLLTEMKILRESYPDLRADNPYLAIMRHIQHAGARIMEERLNFNERVYEYNTMLRVFPYDVFALIYDFKQEPFFEAPLNALKVPSFKELYKNTAM
ncbi:MAG: LemA family protein [Nitrospirae bacterium]|nr:LemA family protein [Nitrospirota bacterium]